MSLEPIDRITTVEDVIAANRVQKKENIGASSVSLVVLIINTNESISLSESSSSSRNTNLVYNFTDSAGGGATNPGKFSFSQFTGGP